jgi:hypothetical protein
MLAANQVQQRGKGQETAASDNTDEDEARAANSD